MIFFFCNMFENSPPDELAQHVPTKSLSDELFLHFSSKVQNLTVFFNYLHDSNSIFRAGRMNSEGVRDRTVSRIAVGLLPAVKLQE